ncbi:MAG: hypothetical protein ACOVNU_03035 [Candidatus Kapaibacteriota bacterium]|jgi:hypothetical protein
MIKTKNTDYLFKQLANNGFAKTNHIHSQTTSSEYLEFTNGICNVKLRFADHFFDKNLSSFQFNVVRASKKQIDTWIKYISEWRPSKLTLLQQNEIRYNKLIYSDTILFNSRLNKKEKIEYKKKLIELIDKNASREWKGELFNILEYVKDNYRTIIVSYIDSKNK